MSLHNIVVDLETTGLDEHADGIIEFAAIGTDVNLEILFEYSAVVAPSEEQYRRLRANKFVWAMHDGNGLLDELAVKAVSLSQVESDLLDVIDTHVGDLSPKKLVLAGSGVSHFDSCMLKVHLPDLVARLDYSTLDAGVMRRAYRAWTGTDLVTVNEDKTHRALDDARCHLTELRAYRQMFRANAAL